MHFNDGSPDRSRYYPTPPDAPIVARVAAVSRFAPRVRVLTCVRPDYPIYRRAAARAVNGSVTRTRADARELARLFSNEAYARVRHRINNPARLYPIAPISDC